jgi:hypothetical protein
MTEPLDHRERRLMQLSEVLESYLCEYDEHWLYLLVIAKPGDLDSVNLLSNMPPEATGEILATLQELAKRYSEGVAPQEL